MSVGKCNSKYSEHESKAGVKTGNSPSKDVPKKDFGSHTTYAPYSKTHISTHGKKK